MKNTRPIMLIFLFLVLLHQSGRSQTSSPGIIAPDVIFVPSNTYIVNSNETVEVSPNPFNEETTIQITDVLVDDQYDVFITNVYGTFKRKIIIYDPGKIVISREGLAEGVYFCRVISPDMNIYSIKFVVE